MSSERWLTIRAIRKSVTVAKECLRRKKVGENIRTDS